MDKIELIELRKKILKKEESNVTVKLMCGRILCWDCVIITQYTIIQILQKKKQ